MAVAIIVPWSPNCPRRQVVWDSIRTRYETQHPDWEILEGIHKGAWSKALAVLDALHRTDADRLVIADADCVCDGLTEALDALDDFAWARPHRDVHRLTEPATDDYLNGGADRSCDPHPYHGLDGGGMVVIRRDAYESVPLDPRFVGWGGEDHAWGLALWALQPEPWRGQTPLLHLWHPPQPDASPRRGPGGGRFMNDNNRLLLDRYKEACRTPRLARQLVDEAREATDAQQRQDRPQSLRDPAAAPVA